MERIRQTETAPSTCSVCGTETESAGVTALHDGATLCVECHSRCFFSEFDLVFEVDES